MRDIQEWWQRSGDEDHAEESSDWPKEWLFSVQSSSTTTPPNRKLYNRVKLPQATP
jgi:hypothetical protein